VDANQKFIPSRHGDRIAVYDWLSPRAQAPRAAVLIAHTLGDYGLRYQQLAQRLTHWGFLVRTFDFYGHNASDGAKGTITHNNRFQEDLADVVADWKKSLPRRCPLILWGYSMGATTVASAQLQGLIDADAYCLISPMLKLRTTLWQRITLSIFRYILPNSTGSAHFTPLMHSGDPQTQILLANDEKWIRILSARLGDTVFQMASDVTSQASQWCKPTLILYNAVAPEKGAVLTSGTEDFFLQSPAPIESKKYEGAYPDLFNDRQDIKQKAYQRLQQWLDRHFPGAA